MRILLDTEILVAPLDGEVEEMAGAVVSAGAEDVVKFQPTIIQRGSRGQLELDPKAFPALSFTPVLTEIV